MRFAFVSSMSTSPWGGSEELWSQAALHLHALGHHVSASVPWWPRLSSKVLALKEQGIKLSVQPSTDASLPLRVWRRVYRRLSGWSPESQWIQKDKPDLVCVSNGNYADGLEFLEGSMQLGIPYVSIVQANAECVWPGDADAERLIQAYGAARQSFFVSQRNRQLLETQLGCPLINAQVIRNPFNVRRDAVLSWPDEAQGLRLACVARLDPSAKGQDLVLEVLGSDRWRDRPITLSFFGAGPMEQGLRRLTSRLGLTERVNFAGHVSRIEDLWATHHALVLPSRYEGLPLALVEAMLCARPAIVTDVAGNSEMVDEGVSGFIAAAPTASHLADALERAWQHRGSWQQIGLAARSAVRARVPDDPAAAFADILLGLLQSDKVEAHRRT